MTFRCKYLELLILVVSFMFFPVCKKSPVDENLFRLFDHFDEVEFITTPLQNEDYITRAADYPRLTQIIQKHMSQDLILGGDSHPLKLKFRKNPTPGGGKGLRSKNVILAPYPTHFALTKHISENTVLRFGFAVINETWEGIRGGVMFTITATDEASGEETEIFGKSLNPELKNKDRIWFESEADLASYAGKTVTLHFKTSSIDKNKENTCIPAWVNPTLFTKTEDTSKVNVILISLDTLRADHISCYGYERETTPNLDTMAAKGVLFRNTIVQAPYTLSSHMSILTSRYPSFHKVNFNMESRLNPEINTLAEIFYNNGYRTWGITGGGQVSSDYGYAEGFESYIEYTAPLKDADRKVRESIEFIHREDKAPFFIFFHTYKPHAPYTPRPPFDTMFADPDYKGPVDGSLEMIDWLNNGNIKANERDLQHLVDLYDGEIRETDGALKKLFDFLRRNKLDKNTLIVVTSDHGEEFGEHGMAGTHSHTLYDELLLVPLIFYMPDSIPAGKTFNEQVRSIDIMPTILDIAGIQFKDDTRQGVSLLDLIHKGKTRNHPKEAFSERLPSDGHDLRSLRTPDFKYIFQEHKAANQMFHYYFDLTKDPLEQTNIEPPAEQEREFFSRIRFLIEEAKNVYIPSNKMELDEHTLEMLKTLGYIK